MAAGLTLALGLLGAMSADATTYLLTQSGWQGGGILTGTFTGQDLNQDGYIDLASGEVSAYEITFSGNALIPAFTQGLADLEYFHYTVGSTGFRPSYPLYSTDGTYFYDADDISIARNDLSVWITADQGGVPHYALVTEIPEPTASLGAFCLAGGWLLVRRTRR
jgi:hypothetical protein